jgi:hypothetical protein
VRTVHAVLRDEKVYFQCLDCRTEIFVPLGTRHHGNQDGGFLRALGDVADSHRCLVPLPRTSLSVVQRADGNGRPDGEDLEAVDEEALP